MKKIYSTAMIEESHPNWFQDKITKNINKYQDDGFEVDIQYSTVHRADYSYAYTALIIAYKNE